MQTIIRLVIAMSLGLIVGLMGLFLLNAEKSIGHTLIYAVLPLVLTAITYLASFGANITISATNCSMNVKKSALVALIPAMLTAILSILFVGLENIIGIFGYIFNKVGISFKFDSNWSAPSIFGVAFFLFWGSVYGQLIAGASAEVC